MEKDNEKLDLSGNLDGPAESQPLDLKAKLMAIQLSNVSAREWLQHRRETVKPWTEFLNTARFKTPKSVAPVGKRVVRNVEHFQSNYLFVFLGLIIFCLLTSPLLIVALAVCLGACYIINLKNKESKLSLLGHEVSLAQQYGAVGVISFPLFWLAGAGSAVFWVIGASFFLIMAHAVFYQTTEELEGFADLNMEVV
ncbi:prenylated Rab acceptor protein 1-like [Lingula anatina]|uniref:PRA1 family protein n=1 Tax=Lingula anatina TaxID=7574 RepID=A0A1S3JIM5_LINAN|nr:prenylated Rab acceptor protein 1-like [Lingula anatina]|eukprot:XP_013410223.1 prenylated Rab acceptor protein 1-like [Lingula anatina]